MAFEYTDIEDEIVARLTQYLPIGYVAMALPEQEKQFKTGPGSKALIVVAYSDSNFDPPAAMDIITQQETVTVLLNIKSANLRGPFSINEAFRLCKALLIGFKPQNLSKLYLQKIEFDTREESINFFSYNITFTGKKLQVEVVEDELLPLLKKLTITEPGDFSADDYISPDFSTTIDFVEILSP